MNGSYYHILIFWYYRIPFFSIIQQKPNQLYHHLLQYHLDTHIFSSLPGLRLWGKPSWRLGVGVGSGGWGRKALLLAALLGLQLVFEVRHSCPGKCSAVLLARYPGDSLMFRIGICGCTGCGVCPVLFHSLLSPWQWSQVSSLFGWVAGYDFPGPTSHDVVAGNLGAC